MEKNKVEDKKILVEILSNQLIRLSNLHYLADMKVYIVLGILGFMVCKMETIIESLIKKHIFCEPCCLLLIILSGIFFIIILFHIIFTLIPRTNSIKENDLYIGTVSQKDYNILCNSYLQKDIDSILQDIICEYKSNSTIAMEKFKHSRKAIQYLILLFITYSILTFITYFSGG
jgi:hypothetical protein